MTHHDEVYLGRSDYPSAWMLSNILRGLIGLTQAAAHLRREKCKALPVDGDSKWSQDLLRFAVLAERLTVDDLPPTLDTAPDKMIYRVRMISEVLTNRWHSWMATDGELRDEDQRWLSEFVGEAYDVAARLRHSVEAAALGRQCLHNSEFTWVRWYGVEYTFAKGQQSRVVQALWREWEDCDRRPGVGISQEKLGEVAGSSAERFELRSVFKDHPAWRKMINRASKGSFALFPPDD